jgi:outer membrane protein OmpA-like peptidoglycan-associated protein
MTGVVGAVLLAGCLSPAAAARRADVIVIAPTATANEYAPALSNYDLSLLRSGGDSSTNAVAYVVNPAAGQAIEQGLTPRRANGQVEYGPRRPYLLTANVSRVERLVGATAATAPFDLLSTMLAASRVTSPPATMLLLSSALSTAGGLNMVRAGWDADPRAVAAQLKRRGLLPRLDGWTVIFSGLGVITAGRQPPLPLPQQTTLQAYWLAICRAAGASRCLVDLSPRPLRPARSTFGVPVVPVPTVQSFVGPRQQDTTLLPTDLLFSLDSAVLLAGADSYLAPLAARERAGNLWVSITGQSSPDGGTESYNRSLSLARARAVRARLIALGVPASKITHVVGVGTAHMSCTVNGVLDEPRCARLRRVDVVLSAAP